MTFGGHAEYADVLRGSKNRLRATRTNHINSQTDGFSREAREPIRLIGSLPCHKLPCSLCCARIWRYHADGEKQNHSQRLTFAL
jgi:hypothetical protein